ncbi:MAG: hypothetical protein OXF33_10680 [Rhodospirillales bacterium]|nr:hypothetical protein [Rhodospirillales bacterium]
MSTQAVVVPAVHAIQAAFPAVEPRLRAASRYEGPRRAGVAVDRQGEHDAKTN